MLLKLLELYEKYDYLVAIAFSVAMWMFGYFTTKLAKQRKTAKIRKLWNLKKDDVEILVPDRYGKLILATPGGATELVNSFVTMDEMEAALILKNMINEQGLNVAILSRPTKDKTNNIFCIGGPLANINAAKYFRDKSIFRTMTIGVHKDSQYLSERNRYNLADLVHEDGDDASGRPIGSIRILGETVFEFDREHEGYVFLVKLSGESDFHNGEKGTVHICFGNNSKTSHSAATCFSKYCTRLSELLKNKKHYCVIFKCDENGEIRFNNYLDITDKILVQP